MASLFSVSAFLVEIFDHVISFRFNAGFLQTTLQNMIPDIDSAEIIQFKRAHRVTQSKFYGRIQILYGADTGMN